MTTSFATFAVEPQPTASTASRAAIGFILKASFQLPGRSGPIDHLTHRDRAPGAQRLGSTLRHVRPPAGPSAGYNGKSMTARYTVLERLGGGGQAEVFRG